MEACCYSPKLKKIFRPAKLLIAFCHALVYNISRIQPLSLLRAANHPGVAQLVARLLWEQDAAGSNPVTRTISLCYH